MKSLFLIATLFLQVASAKVVFDRNVLPESVEKVISQQVQFECPSLYETESLEASSYHQYLGNEIFEHYVKILGRGHGTGDPDYDIEMIVRHDHYSDEIRVIEFKNLISCK